MKELIQLYKDLDAFEKDFEQDSFTDETLARMAFKDYIDNCFDQMQLVLQDEA